jgi:nitrate/nitrite transporter NarK
MMGGELILLLAALIVAALVFTALINFVKTTVKTAILVALVILALQLFFGIGFQEVWNQVLQIIQAVWGFVFGA